MAMEEESKAAPHGTEAVGWLLNRDKELGVGIIYHQRSLTIQKPS
jgi:hypothetical protein